MSEEDRISKKLIAIILIGCLALLIAVAATIITYSPKTFAPVYTEKEEDTFSDNSAVKESDEGTSLSSGENDVFPIEINTASYEELQLIPGIGPKTATLIMDYRNEHGTIVMFRELLSIDGIGEKTVELLEEYCIIN